MSKIKNMIQLREKILQTIDDLESKKIDIHEASVISKLSETIVSGLKSEIQYSILIGNKPKIEFYGKQSGIPLENPLKQLKKLK